MDPYAPDDGSEAAGFLRDTGDGYGTGEQSYYGNYDASQDYSGGDYQPDQVGADYYQQYYYQQYQQAAADPYQQQFQDYQGYQQHQFQNYGEQQQAYPNPYQTQSYNAADSVNMYAASSGAAEIEQGGQSGIATATASPITQDVVARFLAAQRTAEDKSTEKSPGGVGGMFLCVNPDGSSNVVKFLKFVFSTLLVGGLIFALFVVAKSSLSSDKVIVVYDDDAGSTSDVVVEKVVKPNVIFYLADDMGWNSMGYQDFDLSFATPAMTKMAQSGIIMDSYYAQEVCTPSRAALLTGRYPLTTGMQYSIIMPTTSWGLDLDETTIADVLSADGYRTYMFGKWHLGHYSPRYLPTARGFDTFVGFMSGEGYYWSKRNPDHPNFIDLLESNSSCYSPYLQEDVHTYSTFLYRDKAIETIQAHNSSEPFFMYVAFQAVHDPYMDLNHHSKGIPKEYLRDGLYDQIHSEVQGHKRRQYGMALSLIDDAVSDIQDALEDRGLADNTYIIFASDNGGCYVSGGKNGPLRGSKGSLFEGGVRVDAFIYSPLIASEHQGKVYTNIMHVSDWFPTILDLTGSPYDPDSGNELDGVSHVESWYNGTDSKREYVLYNYMYDVKNMFYDKWTNGSFAIRNSKYKLMHTYDSSIYGNWFNYEDTLENDDSLAEGTCNQALAMSGEFTYYLFDLTTDPYETDNIYDSTSSAVSTAKDELYAILDDLAKNSKAMTADVEARNLVTLPTWKDHADYIVPWTDPSDLDKVFGTFPNDCYVESVEVESDDGGAEQKSPTASPTVSPTVAPTSAEPSVAPSMPTVTMPTFPTFVIPTFPTAPTIGIPTFPTFVFPSGTTPTFPMFTPPSVYTFMKPTTEPSPEPTTPPSPEPTTTSEPTHEPTYEPTPEPSSVPVDTPEPTQIEPSEEPTKKPTRFPTAAPVKDDDWYGAIVDDGGKDDDWDDDGGSAPVPAPANDDGGKKSDDDWDDDGGSAPMGDDGGSKQDDDWGDDGGSAPTGDDGGGNTPATHDDWGDDGGAGEGDDWDDDW